MYLNFDESGKPYDRTIPNMIFNRWFKPAEVYYWLYHLMHVDNVDRYAVHPVIFAEK